MEKIKHLAEKIREELNDAEDYAKDALKCEHDDKEMSRTFATLSREELDHAERLHKQAMRIIHEHKEEHGSPPEPMQTIWSWEHMNMVEKTACVRKLLEALK